jgi:hypothetical protein
MLALICAKFRLISCHNLMLRPVSYGPLRFRPLTYKGEIAHEADGATVGADTQPAPNLLSPECPTRGLPKGRKPTTKSEASTNSVSVFRRRIAKRVSESELHGTVNFTLVALLIRESESSRAVEPSHGVVHGDYKSRRSYEQNPSLSRVVPSELGHVVRRSATWRRCRSAQPYREG